LSVELRTGRGGYRLRAAAPLEVGEDLIGLTLALERADGIERVMLHCGIERGLVGEEPPLTELVARLAAWIEQDFERIREAALKSIRTERRLFELAFDREHRGPF
jgi:hypothetical protein